MIIFTRLLLALAVPTFLGINLVRYLAARTAQRMPAGLLLPVGFGIGFGLLTQWMLLLSIVHLRYSLLTVGLPIVAAGILLAAGSFQKNKAVKYPSPMVSAPPQDPRGPIARWLEAGLTVYIAYIVLFVCVRALMVPVLEWDAIAWIALKGKIFFYERCIFQHPQLPNSAYPLHIPLSLTWIALGLGKWSETLVKIIFPVYFLAYGLLHYRVSRFYVSRLWAKASLALLMSAGFFNYHATIAYRDIAIMFYFCGGILLLLLWAKMKAPVLLISSALFFGLASFVKLEGRMYLVIGLCILALVYLKKTPRNTPRRWGGLFRVCLAPIGIGLFYYLYTTVIGANQATQELSFSVNLQTFGRIGALSRAFFQELFLSANWHIIWLLFVLSVIQIRKTRRSFETGILLTTIILYLGTYFILGAVTGLYSALAGINSPNVLSRIVLHIYPLSIFFITLVHGECIE